MVGIEWLEKVLQRLPLAPWMLSRIRKFLRDDGKPSWQKTIVKKVIKYSIVFKVLIWTVMLGHLAWAFLSTVPGAIAPNADPIETTIVVISRNRPDLLASCLASLADADYGEERVHLSVWIISMFGVLSTSLDRRTVALAEGFKWTHGPKVVQKFQQTFADPLGLWPGAFSSNFSTENVVFIEDSAKLSPCFYRWLHSARTTYFEAHEDTRVACISVDTDALDISSRAAIATIPDDTPFVALGSLAEVSTFAPNLHVWEEFGEWLKMRQTGWLSHALFGNTESQHHTASGKDHWTLWFTEFLQHQHMYTVVPHLIGSDVLALPMDSTLSEKALNTEESAPARLLTKEQCLRSDARQARDLPYISASGSVLSGTQIGAGTRKLISRGPNGSGAAATAMTVADLGSETSAWKNWACNLAAIESAPLGKAVFIVGDGLADDSKSLLTSPPAANAEVVCCSSLKEQNFAMCSSALQILRENRPVVFGAVNQVWTRMPTFVGSESGRSFDVAVAIESDGAARGSFVTVMPSTRSRLFVSAACLQHARRDHEKFQDTLSAMLSANSTISASLKLSVRNLVDQIATYADVKLKLAAVDHNWRELSSSIIDNVDVISLTQQLTFWNTTTDACSRFSGSDPPTRSQLEEGALSQAAINFEFE